MVEKNPRSDGEYLNSLARGLAVLRAFDKDSPQMSLSELAKITNLNAAVVRRCLNTLCHLGYVVKKDKLFSLLPEVLNLGYSFIESMNLEEIVRPRLQKMRDETDNSIAFAILSGQDIIFLAYESTRLITRIAAGVGTRFPAYATSAGKVLLAYLDKEQRDEYMKNLKLESITNKTVGSKEKLEKMLAETVNTGYSSTTSELDFGIASVAVPVFGLEQKVIASIVSSTSASRTTEEELTEIIAPQLQEVAMHIERELRLYPALLSSLSV